MIQRPRWFIVWLLFASAPFFAQPVVVAHVSVACPAGCSAISTPAIDTTQASLIVLASSDQGSSVGFTDDQGNVWKPLMRYGSSPGVQLAYCDPCRTSARHTFTHTSGVYPSLAVAAFSGTAGGGFDAQNGVGNVASPIQTGAVATSDRGELVVTAVADQSGVTDSVDSMFTVLEDQLFSPGKGYGIALAWKVQPQASAVNPTWQSSFGSATVAAFRAAPLGLGGGPIASGTVALSTAVIPAGQCSALVPVSAPGAKTLLYTPVPDMTTVAGYAPSSTESTLYITPVVGASQGFRVCSNSSNPITPGALSLNWAAF